MFKKILIANRGEIACRIIKTARKMGIATVAVYSDADAAALHVEMADEKVLIGPPPAAQSYLLGDKIIQACRATGAEAVHPGYGFLSEREWFAEALGKAGIAFIGPSPKAIAAMGDKIESKKLAKAAGVSVVPGFVGEIDNAQHAVSIANDIGYPAMMKASAGGGGKGMRLAYSQTDVLESFQQVRDEAKASFGDDRVFIEKFVEQPRHIEIQVLGDKQGNILYLGERECSIQRRHQKVIEEAPSPFVTPEMRRSMGEQAVELSRAVGYYSAGTVEFIVGADRSFYFLEMNTRLQVEHPVTELTTGIDLVEQMIRVAYGESLPFKQEDIQLKGWAMESRVYAEDPYRSFLPSIGRLQHYHEPQASSTVRVDTGVVEGSEISMYYDPMIAKLVTYGQTREASIAAQINALDQYHIRGIGNNLHFLSAVMQHPRFQSGNITTGFIAEEYPEGFSGAPTTEETTKIIIAVTAVAAILEARRHTIHTGSALSTSVVVILEKQEHKVEVAFIENSWKIVSDKYELFLSSDWQPGSPFFNVLIDKKNFALQLDKRAIGYAVSFRGATHHVIAYNPRTAELARHMLEKIPPDLSRKLICPMPGMVISIAVQEGAEVEAGQPLAIIEAMKMQNILRAEKRSTVTKILANAGDSLAVDSVIMEFA